MSRSLKPQNNDIRPKQLRDYIPNAVFYIPFGYYYAVRLGTVPKLLSWMLIYLMPTAFYSAAGYTGSWALFAVRYLLVLLAVFPLYEYGYILNDTVAIRHEQQPAIRLYEYNFRHFDRWRPLVFIERLCCSLAALIGLYFLCGGAGEVWRVGASVAVMFALFLLYNGWRSRYNVWLYPLLVCSRYVPFMLLYRHGVTEYALLILSFPLINALERFSMPRYRWALMRRLIPDEASKTFFRVAYYAVASVLVAGMLFLAGQPMIWLIPFGLLLLYRTALLFWVKRHNPVNYLNG